jgi:hypothetical protein
MQAFEPGALVLLASALSVDGHPPPAPSDWPPAQSVTRGALRAALRAYDAAGAAGAGAFDAAVTHDAIVAHVMAGYPRDAATAYNRACYFTRRENWAQAQAALDRAVEYGGEQMRTWAQKDPVLDPYRKRPGAEAELEHRIDAMTDPQPSPPPPQPASPAKVTVRVRVVTAARQLWDRLRGARPGLRPQ